MKFEVTVVSNDPVPEIAMPSAPSSDAPTTTFPRSGFGESDGPTATPITVPGVSITPMPVCPAAG